MSKELLTCHRNDTRYISFSLVNKYDAVIGLVSFHFVNYNVPQMTVISADIFPRKQLPDPLLVMTTDTISKH